MSKNSETAEVVALQALGWLVDDEDMCGVFLGASGLSEADLRSRADQPDLLAAVLDFLMMNDAWIMAFCDATGLDYDRVRLARAALPGGEDVHWT